MPTDEQINQRLLDELSGKTATKTLKDRYLEATDRYGNPKYPELADDYLQSMKEAVSPVEPNKVQRDDSRLPLSSNLNVQRYGTSLLDD